VRGSSGVPGQLWNLGADGQYLLAASLVAGIGPWLMTVVAWPVALVLLALVAVAAGALWTIPAGFFKARYGLNEIVTTLMMSFIGTAIANILVKGPFKGPAMVPQTGVIPPEAMLPPLLRVRTIDLGVPGTSRSSCVVHVVLTRTTSVGTRSTSWGQPARRRPPGGSEVPRLIIVAFW